MRQTILCEEQMYDLETQREGQAIRQCVQCGYLLMWVLWPRSIGQRKRVPMKLDAVSNLNGFGTKISSTVSLSGSSNNSHWPSCSRAIFRSLSYCVLHRPVAGGSKTPLRMIVIENGGPLFVKALDPRHTNRSISWPTRISNSRPVIEGEIETASGSEALMYCILVAPLEQGMQSRYDGSSAARRVNTKSLWTMTGSMVVWIVSFTSRAIKSPVGQKDAETKLHFVTFGALKSMSNRRKRRRHDFE